MNESATQEARDGCVRGDCRPSCVLLVDQFGNLHAPFAQARTFLCEQGFGNTRVVVHGADGRLVVLKAQGEKVTRLEA